MAYRLTVRHGPRVERTRHESLDGALAELRRQADRIRSEEELPELSMLRTFEPGDRVNARLEISTGGPLRGRDAGVDVMGNGALVPYRGGIFRRRLEPEGRETAYDVIEAALRG